MTQRRRIAAMLVLFAIGFGLVALASAASASWPLFVTPLPYAAIAWLVVRGDEDDDERNEGPDRSVGALDRRGDRI